MRFEIDGDAKNIVTTKIQRIALESQILFGADGGNVRTLTVAKERGRTETMDDGQGLKKGKRREGFGTGQQWKLNSEGLGWQRQHEWQPRLPMVGIA